MSLSSSCDFNKTHHQAIIILRFQQDKSSCYHNEMSPKAHPFNTTRTHAPLTRLMRCSSTVTIVMLSSSCNLDRHIIRLSSSCDFNKTHHHAITMRRRLTHHAIIITSSCYHHLVTKVVCSTVQLRHAYSHAIVIL